MISFNSLSRYSAFNAFSLLSKKILFKSHLVKLLILGLVCSSGLANEHQVDDVTIYYNAFNSVSIPAEVASQYSITRSNKVGIINISVLKDGKAVIANIFGHGKNLVGQLKALSFKEIKEDQAIYYIATFNFTSQEKITFDLKVQPGKEGNLIPLQFKQQLFSN